MSKEMKKAKEVLEEISKDKSERYIADLREKYILDKNSFIHDGYEKGIIEGKKEERIQLAKRMLEENVNKEIIMRVTKLTKMDIEKIKKGK